jgi:hypothetical protein
MRRPRVQMAPVRGRNPHSHVRRRCFVGAAQRTVRSRCRAYPVGVTAVGQMTTAANPRLACRVIETRATAIAIAASRARSFAVRCRLTISHVRREMRAVPVFTPVLTDRLVPIPNLWKLRKKSSTRRIGRFPDRPRRDRKVAQSVPFDRNPRCFLLVDRCLRHHHTCVAGVGCLFCTVPHIKIRVELPNNGTWQSTAVWSTRPAKGTA